MSDSLGSASASMGSASAASADTTKVASTDTAQSEQSDLFEVTDGDVVRLIVSKCDRCGNLWFPTRPVCGACGSREVRVDRAGPAGSVYASTMVRAGAAGFEAPYCLAYLDIDGLRVLAPVQTQGKTPSAAPSLGAPVRLVVGAFGPLTSTYVATPTTSDEEDNADA